MKRHPSSSDTPNTGLIPITREAWEKIRMELLLHASRYEPQTLGLRVVDGVVIPKETAEQDRRDAERYRWLRDKRLSNLQGVLFSQAMGWKPREMTSAEIDRAMTLVISEEKNHG